MSYQVMTKTASGDIAGREGASGQNKIVKSLLTPLLCTAIYWIKKYNVQTGYPIIIIYPTYILSRVEEIEFAVSHNLCIQIQTNLVCRRTFQETF